MIGWLWQRISGFVLLILLFIHLWKARTMPFNYEYLRIQLTTPKWVIFNILLLCLAISHALNGLWQIGQDYLMGKNKKIFSYFLLIIGTCFILLGLSIFIL
ncbi:MAG: hypothetical protein LWW95_04680 [Candidatus Desulfofervidus auxilii]|nr:hypothetical protein [Candidatus Desulfofervidus auxilii]